MPVYFLDVVDAGVSKSFDWLLIAVIGVTIMVEAGVMRLLKFNPLKKVFLDSLLANAGSLLVGYILIRYVNSLFNSYSLSHLLQLLLISIMVETGILYLLNRSKPFVNTLVVSTLMNIISYTLFFLFIRFLA